MRLRPNPEGVLGPLDELRQTPVRRAPAEHQAGLFEPLAVARVHLVAMPMAFVHDGFVIGLRHLSPRLETGRIETEPLRAALVDDVALLVHKVDHAMGRRRVG